jgi:lipoyl(octanoyl) transferase
MVVDLDALEGELRRVARDGVNALVVCSLRRQAYDDALAVQERLRALRIAGVIPDAVLLVEHPPVYTLGRAAAAADLGEVREYGVPVRWVGRGGKATFHGPGQLVGYPIVDLTARGRDVRAYVASLEDALLDVLAALGLAARRSPLHPGIWIGERKVASIGVSVRRWVTAHGFALNVATDLSYFDRIVTCGIAGLPMTSLAAEGVDATVAEIGVDVARALGARLSYQRLEWLTAAENSVIRADDRSMQIGVPA